MTVARDQTVTGIVGALFVGFAASLVIGFAMLAFILGEGAARPIATTGGVLLAIFLALAGLIMHRLARPLDRLSLDVGIVARENLGHRFALGTRHWLGKLTQGFDAMRGRLTSAEARGAQALAEAQNQGAEQKRWLEAILLDLTDGIVVCNLQHQVLLYNQAAAELLGGAQNFGLGRSLFPFLAREPVLHALERQMQRLESGWATPGARFMCGVAGGQRLLGARLGIVFDAKGAPNGYVLSFVELSEEETALAKRDDLLELATEELRAPIANLRAAAETLSQNPDLQDTQRVEFQKVMLDESTVLSNRLEALARGYHELGGGPLDDGGDLFERFDRLVDPALGGHTAATHADRTSRLALRGQPVAFDPARAAAAAAPFRHRMRGLRHRGFSQREPRLSGPRLAG